MLEVRYTYYLIIVIVIAFIDYSKKPAVLIFRTQQVRRTPRGRACTGAPLRASASASATEYRTVRNRVLEIADLRPAASISVLG